MSRKMVGVLVICVGVVALVFSSIALSENEKKKKDDLFRQVEIFSDALAIVQTDYVNEVQPKELIYGALKGMLGALDPHSQFLDPDTYNELRVDTEGKFGGLGIEITIQDGLLTVVTPIEGTPAWRAGIKAGDRIVKINDELTRDLTLIEAVKKMRGKPGEAVNITILRESEKKILEFKIVRDIIKVNDVKEARILEDGIAYLRLVEFRENTSKDLDNILENLKKQGMNALILDLRNNPGGLLDVAVRVSEKFIEKGKMIVYTKGRKQSQNLEFVCGNNRPILDIPMAVLINEGSASGSEIVAGALQDYKRAIILGKKSFGKGSVQTIIPLNDGSAIRLTTSKYYTPLGREIHGKGLIPDIEVEDVNLEAIIALDKQQEKVEQVFKEVDRKEKEKKVQEGLAQTEDSYKTDNQIMRSIDVLKAIRIYKGNNK